MRVLGHGDVVAGSPLGHHEGARAHRHPVVGRVVDVLELAQDVLGQHGRKAGQERRVEFLVLDDGRVLVGGLHRLDQVVARLALDQVLRVDDGLPGELDVGGGERSAVAPFHSLAQLVGDGQPVLGHPAVFHGGDFRGEHREVFALFVDVDQVFGKRLVNVGDDGLNADVGVEVFGFLVDSQGNGLLGIRDAAEAQNGSSEHEKQDPLSCHKPSLDRLDVNQCPSINAVFRPMPAFSLFAILGVDRLRLRLAKSLRPWPEPKSTISGWTLTKAERCPFRSERYHLYLSTNLGA